jgi:HlyD family secretion protein
MKKWIILILVIMAVLIGGILWNWHKNGNLSGEENKTPVKVERGSIRLSVASSARAVSNLDVVIMSKASGEIINLPFDISDSVKKGDLLAEIDPVDEQRNVNQAKVQVESSSAKVEQARQNLKQAQGDLVIKEQQAAENIKSARIELEDLKEKAARMKKLADDKRVSIEEYQTAQTSADLAEIKLQSAMIDEKSLQVEKDALKIKEQDLALSEASLESDKIKLEIAEQRLSETKVVAPIAGVVSARNVQIGQIVVSPTNNVSGGTALFTLSDLSRMFIIASVDESNIGMVTLGQPVEIMADAYPEDKFDGKVIRIATKGQNVSNVVTFEVKIEVISANKSKLKPEMTTDVEIIAAQSDNALLLPSEVIRKNGEKRYVMLTPDSPSAQKAQGNTALSGNNLSNKRRDWGGQGTEQNKGEALNANREGGNPEQTFSEKMKNQNPGTTPVAAVETGILCPVTTGIDDSMHVEIVSGLVEGDKVLPPTGGMQSQWMKRAGNQNGSRSSMPRPPMF